MSTKVFLNISDYLNRLVVNGGEIRRFTNQKTVDANCNDEEIVLQQFYQRQEYFV